jgi:hypothetical protein
MSALMTMFRKPLRQSKSIEKKGKKGNKTQPTTEEILRPSTVPTIDPAFAHLSSLSS